MHTQSHRSHSRVLGIRALERDHVVLAQLLQPGMSVLDAGCGTGAITRGIARAVGPTGRVMGVDRDPVLLETAQAEHGAVTNLRFALGDLTNLKYVEEFDVVNTARTLQWIANPSQAIRNLARACRKGGMVVALDYNHEANTWEPDAPQSFVRFYQGFLAWRSAHGWDNRMADHLPSLFADAGLREAQVHNSNEVTEPGTPGFEERSQIWTHVMDSLGGDMVTEGFLTPERLVEARQDYSEWTRTVMQRQTLCLRTVTGGRC